MIVPNFRLGLAFFTSILTILLTSTVFSNQTFAQQQQQSSMKEQSKPDSSNSRPIMRPSMLGYGSGQLQNSTGTRVRSSTIHLLFGKDTLSTALDTYGNSRVPSVASAEFAVQVHAMGYKPFYQKYYMK